MNQAHHLHAALATIAFVATTSAQSITWRELDNTSDSDCAMTFDSDRSRFVAVAGGRTLEWDGSDWVRRTTPTPAPSRLHTRLCYDSVHHRTLLFGGAEWVPIAGPTFVNTVWQYDGSDWSLHPTPAPSTRDEHAMAFDPVRGRLVVFGSGNLSASETWEWDGTTWYVLTPPVAPSGWFNAAMAFDAVSGRTILFGGENVSSQTLAETWAWDGTTWTQLAPATVPPARAYHLMASNGVNGTILMYGGSGGGVIRTDSWEWNGTDWVAGPTVGPSPRFGAAMATDSSGQTLLLGGYFSVYSGTAPAIYEQASLGDTWLYPGPGGPWIQLTPTGPPYRASGLAAYDSWRDRLVIASGSTGTVHHTWEWGNGTWTRLTPALELPPIFGGRMCFDRSRGVTVAFGGFVGLFNFLPDTFEWDGTTWVQRTLAGPSPRASHAMTYDEARRNVVVFGGINLGDTWTYDGVAWTQAAITGPSPRHSAAMTYDSARARVVLFGGKDSSGALGDTWEWDGTAWTQRFPAVSPAPRWTAAFGYDRATGRSVLVGGFSPNATGFDFPVAEQWQWDGTNWSGPTDAPVDVRGSSIESLVMVYDDALHALLLMTPAFGGGAGVSTDLWIGSRSVAEARVDGTGCAGSTAPKLCTMGAPIPGNGQFRFDVVDAAANGFVVFGATLGSGALPLGGGCALYLQGALATAAAVANSAGFATLPFPIPANPALVGFEMTVQAAALDPAATLGLTLTPYASVRVGI
ncbi:MAG TPA: hypothetical protein VFZ65_23800 [Planctomycetota bacterium]|nr:hypothetical protein [Planctomycetota bacterium]